MTDERKKTPFSPWAPPDELLELRERTHGELEVTVACLDELMSVVDRFAARAGKTLDGGLRSIVFHILGKLARIICGDAAYPDHWNDVGGYARGGLRLATLRRERETGGNDDGR